MLRRSRFITIILCMAATCPIALAGHWEMEVGPELQMPTGDFWESQAWGLEARGIYWLEPIDETQIGLGLDLGWAQWKADDLFSVIGGTGEFRWSGTADMIPLGVAFLNRSNIGDSLKGTLKLGLRYVLCSDNLTMTRTTDDGFSGTLSQDFDVDCDDAFVGRIGGDLQWTKHCQGRPIQVILSGGYQFDLSRQKISGVAFTQTSSQTLELAAFYVGLGLMFPL